jgi:adenine-specific DNA-methyltransferase
MTTLNGQSEDILKENIAALRELFPEVCCEGKVDFDKLKQVLGEYTDDSAERYNFTWNGKGQALRLSQTPSMGTLRPCKEESKNWDDTQNLYIEGDNLEVLKLLQKSYHGKIKMIYIDPPYNTGSDFVYPDDFSDSIENYKEITGQVDAEGRKLSTNSEANGRYHTDWLNMMYPRLRLARNLLTDDGVIFISIDDNEVYNLRKCCDEIFGEANYVNQFAWVSNITGRQISGKGAAKTWESILAYARNIDSINEFLTDITFAKDRMPDSYKGFNKDIRTDKRGQYAVGDTLYNHNRKFNEETRKNLVFSIFYNPVTEEIVPGSIGEKKDGFVEILPHKNGDGVHQYHAWRWSKQKIINENYDLIVLPTNSGGYEIYTRIRDFNTTLLKDIITNISNGDSEVQKLFDGRKYFDYPKSIDLIYAFLNSVVDDNFTVLDFFSGSATTAHAVMQLNAEDGGDRKFIMVQLPEPCAEGTEAAKAGYKNICEIGKERIRRAGEKIKAEVEQQNAQLKIGEEPKKAPDIGFKDFKLDTSNLKKWQPDADELEISLFDSISNYVDGRSELDVVYEIMLKMGLDLTWPLETHTYGGKNVYTIGMGALMICLDDHITPDVAEGMVSLHKKLAPETWKVVFKDNGFADDSAKVNIKEILKCAGLDEDAFATV